MCLAVVVLVVCAHTFLAKNAKKVLSTRQAYKCYFLGIHQATQAYLASIIDMSMKKVTPNVLFDEAQTNAWCIGMMRRSSCMWLNAETLFAIAVCSPTTRPIHVADFERVLRVYLLDNPPGVVLSDDVSATTVEIYE